MLKRAAIISMAFGLIIAGLLSTESIRANIADCLQAGANLSFSSISSQGCNRTTATTTNATTTPIQNRYFALGDSVAAGLGLPAGSETSAQDKQCGRSSQAYGTAVAKAAGLPYTNIACSGATAGDLLTDQHILGPNPEQQLGVAFKNGTPKLITITAGANDVQWQQFVRLCLSTNCNTRTNSLAAEAGISLMKVKLHAAFSYIQLKSGLNTPEVIITGYYNPLSAQCVNQFPGQLTMYELSWLNSAVASINSSIQSVASQYPFVKYVPVNFTGHEVCSASPWVQGINDPAPLHPTAQGQAAIARAIINRL